MASLMVTQEVREVVGRFIPYDLPDSVLLNYFTNGVPKDDKKFYSIIGRLWIYLATQPNVSQGGISVTWTDGQRAVFYKHAKRFFKLAGDKEGLELIPEDERPRYGYKGTTL